MPPEGEPGGSELQWFQLPTSVILYGPPGALLEWVAWAFASAAPGGYRWTDVRSSEQPPDPLGPITRGAIPPDCLSVSDPQELAPDHAGANAAITSGLRPGAHNPRLEQLSEFLRLPKPTRATITARGPGGPSLVLVVANGHRLLPFYSASTVGSTLQTLRSHGISVLNIFPEVPTENRFLFDNVWHLSGSDPRDWRGAVLSVEKADPSGTMPARGDFKVKAMPGVAASLARALSERL